MRTIQERWKEICNEYLKLFCERHDYEVEYDGWIGLDPSGCGTVVYVGDMYIDMEDLRYDVDNDIQTDQFEKWYWKRLELAEYGVDHWMNYKSFCLGAPDEWTPERIQELKEAYDKVQEAKERLEQICREEYGK